jgi:uncharacterized membrane protein YeaQ/YmgE (transglycosylase-associated protein family)
MDYVTLASQLLGGVTAAFLAGRVLRDLDLGIVGDVVVGIVGGSLAGLILTNYLSLVPAGLPDGRMAPPLSVLAQIAAGATGGVILLILTGLLTSLVRA